PSAASVVPRIDNNTASGLVYGKVMLADGTPVANATVRLGQGKTYQYDQATDAGDYLFEFITIDPVTGRDGNYSLRAYTDTRLQEVQGVIRSVGQKQQLNIVFIGQGSVAGKVTYDDGQPLAGATVFGTNSGYNNPLQGEMRKAT